MEPLVSIIMPVYNGEKFIFKAIDSIIKQTYQNWEIVAIDDGSTDLSMEVVKGFNDSRIFELNVRKRIIPKDDQEYIDFDLYLLPEDYDVSSENF